MAIQKTYTHSPFKGQIHCPAPVTPFAPNGDLMLDAYQEILRFHLETSADTFLIAGDNGEGYVLSDAELAQVIRTAAKTIGGRFPWYVNVSRLSTDETVARARVAVEAGAPGICVTPQWYLCEGTPDEVVARYEAIAKAISVPMMAYDCPKHTGITIAPETLKRICDVAPVNILKEGHGVIEHATLIISQFGNRFPVLIGLARGLVPALLLGSGGFVGTGPELFGRDIRKLFDVHTMGPDERMAWHLKVGEAILAASFSGTSPSGIKAALNMIGLPAGVPRAPVKPLTPAAEAKLRDTLIRIGVPVVEQRVAKRA